MASVVVVDVTAEPTTWPPIIPDWGGTDEDYQRLRACTIELRDEADLADSAWWDALEVAADVRTAQAAGYGGQVVAGFLGELAASTLLALEREAVVAEHVVIAHQAENEPAWS